MTATQDPDSTTAEDLNDSEQALLEAAATGKVIDLRTGDGELVNPVNAGKWSTDRDIRAEFLADLLTGVRTPKGGHLRSVKLYGARVTGPLNLESRKILCPVELRECYFTDPINMMESESASIRLPGCHTPGLRAKMLRTNGVLELNDGFSATGEIDLEAARIDGFLNLDSASLANRDGHAINAAGIIVNQDMSCSGEFTARGMICLPGAHIGGHLDFSGATLDNHRSWALKAEGISVDQSMYCGDGFTARGTVALPHAQISGQLAFTGIPPDSNFRLVLDLDLEQARIDALYMPEVTDDGRIDLTNAQVRVLHDHPESWPDNVRLRGFYYDRFDRNIANVRSRLQWLKSGDEGFTPGVYDQLADAYQRAGDDTAARKVAVAKQWRRRKLYSPLNWLWWATVGYGYRTWQAFLWAVAFILVGWAVFSGAYPAHMVALTPHPPAFQPLIYTLDVLLPIGGLGQKAAWQPTTPTLLRWYWALAIAGWVLSAAVVAGLSGILKRD